MFGLDATTRAVNNKSFDELFRDIAARLLKVNPRSIDNEIRRCVMDIGKHYRVDNVQLRKFSADRLATNLLHWWSSSDEIGLSVNLPNDAIPWASLLILRGDVVRIGQLSDMPRQATSGRQMLEADGLHAALLVPLDVGEQVYGALMLGSTQSRQWSDEIVRESQLLGEVLAHAHERAQVHSALWTSETRLRAVLENQMEFIVRWLPDGTRTWVNDRYCQVFQQPRESLIGSSFGSRLVDDADQEQVALKAKAMTPDNPSQTADHKVRLPSGEIGWHNWTDKGIFDDSGTLIEIQSVGRDITDRKLTESALVLSEVRYRSLIENSADWIWEMNLDLERTYSNHQLEAILGYTSDEMQDRSTKQLMHPEDLPAFKARIRDLIDGKLGWQRNVFRMRHKNGTYRHLESSANPVFDAEGNLCAIHGIDRDITDALVARDNIERVEQKYRVLVESTNDAVYLLDGKRIIDCNNKALQVSQRTREELMGFSPWENFPVYQPDGSKSKDMAETIFKDVESGNPQRFEWQQLRPDGAVIDHDISLTPIELTGEGLRILMVARDITDDKQAQREAEHRAEFKRLLADMSSRLLRSPIEDTVARVNEAFAEVCARYELDSAGLWWFSGDTPVTAERYAGWRRDEDTSSRPPEYQAETPVPWFAAQVLKGNIIQIDDVYDMPDEAGADQKTLLSWGARALLGIPVSAENRIAGCCVFNSAEQRAWDQETIQELGLIGDTITAACSRHRATAELLRNEQDLARSQQVGRLGNFKFTIDDASRGFPPQGKLEVSPQFRKLFDIDTQVPSFKQVIARIHPDDLKRFLIGVKKGMETGVDFQEVYRIVRTDGTVIHAEDRSVYEADETGRTKRIFGTVQDMTDQVEAKQKIESALREIEKLKDRLQQENIYLREEIRVAHGFGQIIGDSPQLRQALVAAEKVAPTSVPVLILGETGTGKELIAQAIHDLSGRKENALITVNCAALSKDLIESELFGHEKGAFTGAHTQRKGRFERANGGTLFLDEIGDLPAESQAKLLRVLQTGGFERVGGLRTLHVDARLIAATNKNLKRAVDDGAFRADLYYRISSFPIELPPLRERPDDIPALTEFLVAKHAKRMGKDIRSISARTIHYLASRQWPGNVRELEGVVQRALISTMGPVLDYFESYDVEPEFSVPRRATPTVIATDLRTIEREHIVGVLERSGWVISGELGAASMMGIPPSTLRSKMKRLGIERQS